MSLPTLSIVIATFNSDKTLSTCLESISRQDYPRDKIEIIIADGGSTDNTLSLGKRYGAKIVHVESSKQGAEYNRATGAHAAKNEILVFLDHDNILPHSFWFKRMVGPLMEDRKIVGVETLRYHYDHNDSPLGRFFSLFGVNDSLPFYLGKADRLAYFIKSPGEYGTFREALVKDKGSYFMVDFAKNSIPTLGSNGFLIRRRLLFQHAKVDLDYFFHIDVNVDLIRKGFNRYAFIKDSIIHHTHEKGLIDYLRRRKLFMEQYHLSKTSISQQDFRRYSVFERKDTVKLIWFVFISLTLVIPLFDSLRGYRKIHDWAWFLHPLLCFALVILYGWVIIRHQIKIYVRKFLEE